MDFIGGNMARIKDLSNVIVLSDFDGTITTFDTNIRLFDIYGDEEFIAKNRKAYSSGEIDLKTLSNMQFNSIELSKEKYLNYMLREIKLQEGFGIFYNNLKKHNIPFVIVSGGFSNGIQPFLRKHGYSGIPIHANRLNFAGANIRVEHYEDEHFSDRIHRDDYIDFKVEILKDYKDRYEKIVFLGDGSTDIHVAGNVDYLFAKDYLEKYCIENGIDYIGWEDFHDVNRWFEF